jgi:hypothetical protein
MIDMSWELKRRLGLFMASNSKTLVQGAIAHFGRIAPRPDEVFAALAMEGSARKWRNTA